MVCEIFLTQSSEGEEVIDEIIEIRNLKVNFYTYRGVVQALDNVNLEVKKGRILGLVGETACGKSVTALSILRLIMPPGKILGGEILFEGTNLLEKSEIEMRKIRGKKISMVFQEVTSSLNPVLTIGSQIADVISLHQKADKEEAKIKALEMLEKVRISNMKLNAYPHQLSDGMNQRVMIAMALSCNPRLLIADEPVTALDVTTQAQILKLMKSLQQEYQFSMLFITHNLGIVAENCDDVAVMYAGGHIMEYGSTEEVLSDPKHPYTQALLRCIPHVSHTGGENRLYTIGGVVPSLINPPTGCRFHPRCPFAKPICSERRPEPVKLKESHLVSCHLHA